MIGGKIALLTNKETAGSARCYLGDLTWQLIYWYLVIAKAGELNKMYLSCIQNKSNNSRSDTVNTALHTSSKGRRLGKDGSAAADHTAQCEQTLKQHIWELMMKNKKQVRQLSGLFLALRSNTECHWDRKDKWMMWWYKKEIHVLRLMICLSVWDDPNEYC